VLAARPLFLRYVRDFGQYNLIYGSVAVAVILVLWAWVVALILLFGGELASHVQAMAIEGQAAEQVARQHQERSPTHPRKST
jgi:membrane protein